jgi:hypothetical protein
MRQIRIEVEFAKHFQQALRKRFGRLPSAAYVALRFNRQLENGDSVSDETVRRWMRGCSMPTYRHLQSLCAWLELDVNSLIHPEKSLPYPPHVTNTGTPTSAHQLSNRLTNLILGLEPELQERLAVFLGSLKSPATSRDGSYGSYGFSRVVDAIPMRDLNETVQRRQEILKKHSDVVGPPARKSA